MRLGPPSGFRDFAPADMILRKKVISIIEDSFIRYGYDPIETPVLEYWETFKGKYGEETENKLMYKFKDPWSDKWFALRFDLTVPMARFFASKAFPIPFKRYHIGRVWRHERPQRGRYREFWQADADIIGSEYPEADAELLDLTIHTMLKLGFNKFTVKLNDRRLLKGIFEEELGLRDVLATYRAIDKLDKIGYDGVKEELRKVGLSENTINRIIEIISTEFSSTSSLDHLIEQFSGNENVEAGIKHLTEIIDLLGNKKRYVSISLNLVRGLDYYTGPVWEVILTDVPLGSVAGGGRYDDLIGIYAGKKYPATGTSFGVERIIDAGKEIGIFNADKVTYTQIYITTISREAFRYAWNLVKILRNSGFSAQIDLMRRTERKQREYANKKNIPIAIYIGPKELAENKLTIYNKRTNERWQIDKNEVIEFLRRLL